MDQGPARLLKLSGISKAFAGVQALSGGTFDLRAGEVHALVGENGAGKSTLVKVITGAHLPDGGTIEVHGQTVRELDPIRARGLGDCRDLPAACVVPGADGC
jgi:ABC-type sugar transport system ATPase subunit